MVIILSLNVRNIRKWLLITFFKAKFWTIIAQILVMILEFGASMIIDRPVYGLLRRRSVTKWLMIVLVPNSSVIIRISELIVQNFAFIFKPLKNYFLFTVCFIFHT